MYLSSILQTFALIATAASLPSLDDAEASIEKRQVPEAQGSCKYTDPVNTPCTVTVRNPVSYIPFSFIWGSRPGTDTYPTPRLRGHAKDALIFRQVPLTFPS